MAGSRTRWRRRARTRSCRRSPRAIASPRARTASWAGGAASATSATATSSTRPASRPCSTARATSGSTGSGRRRTSASLSRTSSSPRGRSPTRPTGCVVEQGGQDTWVDRLAMLIALGGVSMPSFWLGLLLIFVFSLQLGWFPATGHGGINRLILPAATIGLNYSAVIARLVRSSLLEVLGNNYISTARAKGLSEWGVTLKHALGNALIPVTTIIGVQLGNLLAGTIIVETVFSRRGMGRLAVTAVLDKDYPLIQGVVLVSALGYVLTNLLVDLSYSVLDPRIRHRDAVNA